MGVKDLWGILTPICERKPIWELQDKTIAIDLSAWICDSSTIAEHSSQKNMYLRNLFFRTSYLLLLGVKPIFVLEGKAPVLKHDTIEKRQQAQGRSAGRNVQAGSRARLKGLQTQCAALLTAMGLKCIQGDGEAEAYCALLNQAGLVDGVVTQDSDVFLYGAVKVYRHFNTSCAGGGSVDTYHMDEIQSRLGLGRNKLIALSLLCGCDYNKGVSGVGKESALKFFQSVHDGDILDRIQSWRQNTHMDNIDVKKDKSISPELKCELQIRAKALQDPDFPCRELLAEFLQNDHKEAPRVKFQWSKPNVNQFLKLADIKLAWDSTYALEKVLPLLTRWHLTHTDSSLTPELILNAKTTRGIKGYVVKWSEFDLNTEEPQALFEAKYPEVVRAFLETKAKGKKKAVTKKNKENDLNEIPKPKTKRGKAKTNTDTDILHEINTDYNADFPSKRSQHIEKDKSTNENRTKPEKTKKETRKKNPKTENTKKRTDKSKKENKGAVDIRTYFLTKSTETAPDGIEDIDESINLLNTSLNSLSINTNRMNSLSNRYKEASDIEHLDKEAIDIKHDMSSIIIEDTDTHRMKRDVLDMSNIIGDVSMNGSLSNRIAGKSDNLWETSDYRNVDNVVGDTSMNESLPIDKATARKLDRVLQETKEYRKEDEISKGEDKAESVHLIDDDDILNYSFNTACKIMSKEHKQDRKKGKKQPVLDDFDELADIELSNDRSENLSSKCSEKIRNLTFSDISMTNGSKIDIFNVVAHDLASNKTRMNITNEMDDNSRTKRDTNTCNIFTNSYVILDDSLVENKINFNDSLVENKINFNPEKERNISEIKHNSPNKKPETTISSKMCGMSIISNVTIDDSVVPNKIDITDMNDSPKKCDKLNDPSLILLDSFNTKTMDFADFESHPNQSKERKHHNQSLESMSFTETTLGNYASPNAMEQSPKFSQANFSYEKFSDSKLSDWNTSSPLVRHKLPLVSTPREVNNLASNSSISRGLYPPNTDMSRGLHSSNTSISRGLSSPHTRKSRGLCNSRSRNNTKDSHHEVSLGRRSPNRGCSSIPTRFGTRKEFDSFDMDDFECDEGAEDLSEIIENIVSQK